MSKNKRFIKLVSIALVCVMVMVMCMGATSGNKFAFEQENLDERQDIYELAERIVAENSNLEVLVVDGVLHIVDNTPPSSAATTYVLAPNGGSYRKFFSPIFYQGQIPFSMVFLPLNAAKVLHFGKNNISQFEGILISCINYTHDQIIEMMQNDYGQTITTYTAILLASLLTIDAILWIDRISFNNVYGEGNPLCIKRTTYEGWPAVGYSVWTGSSVSPSPYSSFNPSFHIGEYDVIY